MRVYKSPNIAAILVGGKGARLRSLISDIPKPLAPIAGEPFLFIVLRQLVKVGIQRVVLLSGYLSEKIREACGDGSQFGLEIIYSEELEPLGTAGALSHSKVFFQEGSSFILMNGDTYLDCSLEAFFQSELTQDVFGIIGTIPSQEIKRFSQLEIDPLTMRISSFSAQNTIYSYVNVGIYHLSTKIFEIIPEKQFSSLEDDIFPSLIQSGKTLKAFPLTGKFIDIGIPESYLAFNEFMKKERGILQC